MIEPETDDNPKLNRTELPETVALTAASNVYHAPTDSGTTACNAGSADNVMLKDRIALNGYYPPCKVCFNCDAVKDQMLADADDV